MIGIIDYGLGNLGSVSNALASLHIPHEISSDPSTLSRANALILPGVGAAAAGMQGLRERNLIPFLIEQVKKQTPLLGLCLGMQLLFSHSEEGDTPCLGIIPGSVKKFTDGKKIPHIGWNTVSQKKENPLFFDIPSPCFMYFVHSYYCVPNDESQSIGMTTYGSETFSSIVQSGRVYGAQFHPEKSSIYGLQLLQNMYADAK